MPKIEDLEAAALKSQIGFVDYRRPGGGDLRVYARGDGSFQYEWGDSIVSRREAATRLTERGH